MNGLFRPEWSTLKKLMFLQSASGGSYETITGNPVSFTTVRSAPLKQLSVAFSPIQSGSGDPSPDNVRPISGWSSLTVEQRGVNQWDEEWEVGGINDTTGEDAPVGTQIRSKNYIPCIPNTEYYANVNTTLNNTSIYIYFYDADKTFLSRAYAGGYNVINKVITAPLNCYYMRFKGQPAGGTVTYFNNISINYPATDTAYHAYNLLSRSISISLGQTVYSGYVDVVTGQGEVTHGHITLDGTQTATGAANWRASEASVGFYYNFPIGSMNVAFPATTETKPNGISSALVASAYNDLYYYRQGYDAGFAWIQASGLYDRLVIRLPDTTLTTWELINAYLTQHPITVVYELAEPIPISLTPQEINSLAGDNVLFSDANGDLTVEYRSN